MAKARGLSPNNLRASLTSFIGREREIAETTRLLAATRLLTLTGTGGCGKSRLALEVARALMKDFSDGVWAVELAPLSEATLVPYEAPEDLAKLYEARGVTRDKDVIAHCRIRERSSLTWFTLTYLLGYPRVQNYDGSWTEWGSLVGVPIEKSV